MTHNLHNTLQSLKLGTRTAQYYSLPELAKTYANVSACQCRSASCSSRCCAIATARK